jgi:DNA integrity scanning protein DisA with diadenylate cyclase activity
MPVIEKSEVVKHILQKLIDISSRKTTEGHAILTIEELIKKLEEKYDFLKHVEIKDTRFLELDDSVSVMSDINVIKLNDVGRALSDIIIRMNIALGEDAGHFFIKELRSNIEEAYDPIIKNMGLDLGLMQLEHEVNELEKKLRK